jgi:hypothetical protein
MEKELQELQELQNGRAAGLRISPVLEIPAIVASILSAKRNMG